MPFPCIVLPSLVSPARYAPLLSLRDSKISAAPASQHPATSSDTFMTVHFRGRKTDPRTEALKIAALHGKIEDLKNLLAQGVPVNTEPQGHLTALMSAANKGHADCVATLIQAGADVNRTTVSGKTVLMTAVESNNIHCVELVLGAGADIQAKTKDYHLLTALEAACSKGNVECIQLLLDNGARFTRPDELTQAAMSTNPEALKLVFEKSDWDINAEDAEGKTALMRAAGLSKNTACVEFLLANGAETAINRLSKDRGGNTALQIATYNGAFDTVKALVAAGAKIEQKNNWGQSAIKIAESKKAEAEKKNKPESAQVYDDIATYLKEKALAG